MHPHVAQVSPLGVPQDGFLWGCVSYHQHQLYCNGPPNPVSAVVLHPVVKQTQQKYCDPDEGAHSHGQQQPHSLREQLLESPQWEQKQLHPQPRLQRGQAQQQKQERERDGLGIH